MLATDRPRTPLPGLLRGERTKTDEWWNRERYNTSVNHKMGKWKMKILREYANTWKVRKWKLINGYLCPFFLWCEWHYLACHKLRIAALWRMSHLPSERKQIRLFKAGSNHFLILVHKSATNQRSRLLTHRHQVLELWEAVLLQDLSAALPVKLVFLQYHPFPMWLHSLTGGWRKWRKYGSL